MADLTYSFKTDEETKERIKQLIEESGISGKDFFGNLLSAYELEKAKILSAVMHADERNKALSEQLGHDVYHYHLHVV